MDTMSQGQCINLGFEYDEFTQEIIETYIFLQNEQDYTGWTDHAMYRKTIESIIANCNKTVMVSKTSEFYPYLSEHIGKGRVVCYEDITVVFTMQNTLVFMDDNEIYTGIMGEFMQLHTTPILPSWVISKQKIITIMHYMDKLLPLSRFIAGLQKMDKREFVFFSISEKEYIFASLLLLLCRNCTGIMAENRYCFSYIINTDIGYSLHQKNFDSTKKAFFVLNAYAAQGRHRFLRWVNTTNTFYFLYGDPKKQPLTRLKYTPFFLWLYPHAGTNRVNTVFYTLTLLLGLNNNAGLDRYYAGYFYGRTPQQSTTSSMQAAKLKLYDMLLENSFIYLHAYVDLVSDVFYTTNAKAIILIRDMRDILISYINWHHGASIKYCGADFEEIAMRCMKDLNDETRDLTQVYAYENAYFLKFEDVHADPLKAYMKLFDDFGFTKDPYWVDDIIIPQLKQRILESQVPPALIPHAGKAASCHLPDTKAAVPTSPAFKPDYRISNGKPGGWINYFTPRMKAYFKENSNNVLQLFGYEADNNW